VEVAVKKGGMEFFPKLGQTISEILSLNIQGDRKEMLGPLVQYVATKLMNGKKVNLNFICTHNSRRSQFSQVWASVASNYYGLTIGSFSGGIEVTEFNDRAIKTLRTQGFEINSEGVVNPEFRLRFSEKEVPIVAFSKIYLDDFNPKNNFAAVITCDHANENCPVIEGAEARISIDYEDPKKYDETALENQMYLKRSSQIASELFFVFRQVKELLEGKN